ncbi:MAG: hypothetical protein RLZZ214_2909 [Verrucomicrobiota bacterium]|jgi:hypothetical protein
MSLLPQHKKSAEEIAKLRETLGIPGELTTAAESAALQPEAEVHPPKQVHSLKRSEKIPGLPEEDHEPHVTLAEPVEAPAEPVEPVVHTPKVVRSLRKSEQGPPPEVHTPPPDSKLPIHRHSEEQIQRIRRHETLAMQANASYLLSRRAHLALVIPGYLFAAAGGVSFYFYDFDKAVTAACVGVALLIAAFIFFKKPLSVHHAAFIAVASLFVIVFGALHYFPQLQHGT